MSLVVHFHEIMHLSLKICMLSFLLISTFFCFLITAKLVFVPETTICLNVRIIYSLVFPFQA